MADVFDKETRSRVMRAVKSSGTKPERLLKEALGLHPHGDRPVDWLPGKPDVLIGRLAVFVHGCFWHCCPKHFKPVDGGRHDGWKEKFRRNVLRDARVRRKLRKMGYATAVVWEHEIGRAHV